MPSVRIWAIESDYDRDAVECLAKKIASHLSLDLEIYSAGKTTFANVAKSPDGLRKAVLSYLKQDCCVIFVLDLDGPISQRERADQPNHPVNQVRAILQTPEFTKRTHLVLAKSEIEAWLLVDCMGIAGFFARQAFNLSPQNCHSKLESKPKIKKLVQKRQAGDTTRFIEAVPGGRNAKEELIHFSKEILLAVNPKLKPSDLKDKCYEEKLAPEIATYVEISRNTIKRNTSLVELHDTIRRYGNTK